jgi:hypothetical protein
MKKAKNDPYLWYLKSKLSPMSFKGSFSVYVQNGSLQTPVCCYFSLITDKDLKDVTTIALTSHKQDISLNEVHCFKEPVNIKTKPNISESTYKLWKRLLGHYEMFSEIMSILNKLATLTEVDETIIKECTYFLTLDRQELVNRLDIIKVIKSSHINLTNLQMFGQDALTNLIVLQNAIYIYLVKVYDRLSILKMLNAAKIQITTEDLEAINYYFFLNKYANEIIDKIRKIMPQFILTDNPGEENVCILRSKFVFLTKIFRMGILNRADVEYELYLTSEAENKMQVVQVESIDYIREAFLTLKSVLTNLTPDSKLTRFLNMIDHGIQIDVEEKPHFRYNVLHDSADLNKRMVNLLPNYIVLYNSNSSSSSDYVYAFLSCSNLIFINECRLNTNTHIRVKAAQLMLILFHELLHIHRCYNGANKYHFRYTSPLTKLIKMAEIGKTLEKFICVSFF